MEERDSIECWVYVKSDSGPLLLLLKTPEREHMPSFWQPVTGGMQEGEGEEEACAREVFEETGLRLRRLARLPFSQTVTVEGGARRIKKRVFAGAATSQAVALSDQHVDHLWCDADAARDLLAFDTSRDALARVIEHLRTDGAG